MGKKFISKEIEAGTYVKARLVVEFTPNCSNNTSDVAAYVQMWRTNTGYTTSGTGTLHIGIDGYGWWQSDISNSQKITYNSYTQIGSTRNLTIKHDDDGRWTGKFYVYTKSGIANIAFSQHEFSVTLDPNPVYTLTTTVDTGSSVVVNRTCCAVEGGTGNLSDGTQKLYYGDILKITLIPSANYSITTSTVNGSAFTSGNSHTVTGDVAVVAQATPLKSTVCATDADIGKQTTITITQYNPTYTHKLTYSFGNLTGTIIESTSDTSVEWSVPNDFYNQIPNSPDGVCIITCATYHGAILLGDTTCTFTATANQEDNIPKMECKVTDSNPATLAITGDSNVLIKNKSIALCLLKATPMNTSSISAVKINNTTVDGEADSNGAVNAFQVYDKVADSSFKFYAEDSRGYSLTTTIEPNIVNYITLTCNPAIYRNTPTGNTISMDVSGNFYRGSFGGNHHYYNTLILQYRYRKSNGSFPTNEQTLEDGSVSDASGWITVDTIDTTPSVPSVDNLGATKPHTITVGTSSYRSNNSIPLQSYPTIDEDGEVVYAGFDYRSSYVFEIRAIDGTGDLPLSTVVKKVLVPSGRPVFDWGETDFNFNVPVKINNVNILDIVFPVGVVYTHSNNILPTAISDIGTWESVTTGMNGMYAWKRTE